MRTIVYIDGFNLYYGACRAPGRRWLNPLALAQRLLPKDDIAEIAYFTANIKRDPEDPGAQDRQRLYHRALQTIPGLEIFLGRYISKRVRGGGRGVPIPRSTRLPQGRSAGQARDVVRLVVPARRSVY